ncbi:DUF3185 family protein [Termitidicoccus mucosus]|uniref:DUF3185 domain-containing protein n=1 Tax=Termitidicoccus mucosus TaxID=1184151 RepID=A0A178IFC1_9BACT|nr:hypothetical protein AW736_19210 [Opitutaceae bacterium TSB47]
MNRIISVVLLAGGIALIGYGISSSDSIGSGFSRFFTGTLTDKTIWLFAGGSIAIIAGLTGLFRGPRTL